MSRKLRAIPADWARFPFLWDRSPMRVLVQVPVLVIDKHRKSVTRSSQVFVLLGVSHECHINDNFGCVGMRTSAKR